MNIIEYHEEDCEFRDILCFFAYCDKTFSAKKLPEHIKSVHHKDISIPSPNLLKKRGAGFIWQIKILEKYFNSHTLWATFGALIYQEKSFWLLFKIDKGMLINNICMQNQEIFLVLST